MAEENASYLRLRGQRRKHLAAEVADRFVRDRLSVHELASAFGHRACVMRRLLDEAGVYEASRTLIGTDEQETASSLARRYERAGSIAALVRATGMDKRLIRRLLLDAGVSLPAPHSLTTAETEQVVARYRAGAGIRELAASIGSSYGTVRAAVQAAEVAMRPRGGREAQGAGNVAGAAGSADPVIGLT